MFQNIITLAATEAPFSQADLSFPRSVPEKSSSMSLIVDMFELAWGIFPKKGLQLQLLLHNGFQETLKSKAPTCCISPPVLFYHSPSQQLHLYLYSSKLAKTSLSSTSSLSFRILHLSFVKEFHLGLTKRVLSKMRFVVFPKIYCDFCGLSFIEQHEKEIIVQPTVVEVQMCCPVWVVVVYFPLPFWNWRKVQNLMDLGQKRNILCRSICCIPAHNLFWIKLAENRMKHSSPFSFRTSELAAHLYVHTESCIRKHAGTLPHWLVFLKWHSVSGKFNSEEHFLFYTWNPWCEIPFLFLLLKFLLTQMHFTWSQAGLSMAFWIWYMYQSVYTHLGFDIQWKPEWKSSLKAWLAYHLSCLDLIAQLFDTP